MHDTKAALAKSNYYDPFKTTIKGVLPYRFRLLVNGEMVIERTKGFALTVSRSEVERILKREDLDVGRRRMYEAALEVWKQDEKVQ